MTAAERARKMSDRELYSLFTGNGFYADQELAMAAVQEAEDREARRSGREPILITFEKLSDGTLGQCGNNAITLDISFLEPDRTGIRTPAELLSVIIHEGRHAWQNMILKNPPENMSPDMYYSLIADRWCYISTDNPELAVPLGLYDRNYEVFLQYAMQENEMDARYYALQRMKEIAKLIPENDALETEIIREEGAETERIMLICRDFDEEILEKLETSRREAFIRRVGEELPEGFEYFKNFRVVIRVIKPLLERIDELEKKGVLIDRNETVFTLYAASREAELEGLRLDTPEDLLSFAFERSFKLEEFGLEKNMFLNEIGRIKS